MLKKKIWASFKKIIELLSKNLSLTSQKYGFGIRDPEKNLFRIPDPGPGVKKAPGPGFKKAPGPGGQKGTGSRSATLATTTVL